MELTYIKNNRERHVKGLMAELVWYYIEKNMDKIDYLSIKGKIFKKKDLFQGNKENMIHLEDCYFLDGCIIFKDFEQVILENNHFLRYCNLFFRSIQDIFIHLGNNDDGVMYDFVECNRNATVEIRGNGTNKMIYPSNDSSITLQDAQDIEISYSAKSLSMKNSSCIYPKTYVNYLFMENSKITFLNGVNLKTCIVEKFKNSKIFAPSIVLSNRTVLNEIKYEKLHILEDGVIDEYSYVFPNDGKKNGKGILIIDGDPKKEANINFVRLLKSVLNQNKLLIKEESLNRKKEIQKNYQEEREKYQNLLKEIDQKENQEMAEVQKTLQNVPVRCLKK